MKAEKAQYALEGAMDQNGTVLRYSEVLSVLSLILDMAEGQPEGHVLRSCFIGMMIGERVGLSEEDCACVSLARAPFQLVQATSLTPRRLNNPSPA